MKANEVRVVNANQENGKVFFHMKNGKTKIIVLKDHVLSYTIGNSLEKEKVINKCRELGINEAQLDWAD